MNVQCVSSDWLVVCFAEVNSLQTAVDQSYVGTRTRTCRRLDGEARERWEAL